MDLVGFELDLALVWAGSALFQVVGPGLLWFGPALGWSRCLVWLTLVQSGVGRVWACFRPALGWSRCLVWAYSGSVWSWSGLGFLWLWFEPALVYGLGLVWPFSEQALLQAELSDSHICDNRLRLLFDDEF